MELVEPDSPCPIWGMLDTADILNAAYLIWASLVQTYLSSLTLTLTWKIEVRGKSEESEKLLQHELYILYVTEYGLVITYLDKVSYTLPNLVFSAYSHEMNGFEFDRAPRAVMYEHDPELLIPLFGLGILPVQSPSGHSLQTTQCGVTLAPFFPLELSSKQWFWCTMKASQTMQAWDDKTTALTGYKQ
ncbi:hypothetical protein BKA83DRAFT_4479858 [Pisolithus microcarpus]|nr:hypothetical protein BKA83DRAFT_4479858 [Pisolithus microcarpus]